jgi:hypothetical protein
MERDKDIRLFLDAKFPFMQVKMIIRRMTPTNAVTTDAMPGIAINF